MNIKTYIISFFALAIISCNNTPEEDIQAENTAALTEISLSKEQIQLAGIQMGTVENKNISSTINCKGRVIANPQNRAKISVPMNGYVNKIFVQNGQNVKQGQVLASLSHPDFIKIQKDFLQAKNKLSLLEKELDRQKILNKENAGNAKNLEISQSDFNAQATELQALKLELELLNINPDKLFTENISKTINVLAPISGKINEIQITIGQFVRPEDVLLELINNKDFVIELLVFERDIHKVAVGQTLTYECNIPESSDSLHKANLTHISNYVNEETKTFKAHAKPEKCIKGLQHGIYIDAEITISENQLSVLPESAIFYEEEKAFIFVVKNDSIFEKKYIEIGLQDENFVELKDSKPFENSKIVISGGNYILAEMEKE